MNEGARKEALKGGAGSVCVVVPPIDWVVVVVFGFATFFYKKKSSYFNHGNYYNRSDTMNESLEEHTSTKEQYESYYGPTG